MLKAIYSFGLIVILAMGCGDDAASSRDDANADTAHSTNNEQTESQTDDRVSTDNTFNNSEVVSGEPTRRGCPRLVEGSIYADTEFNECETYVIRSIFDVDFVVGARLTIAPKTTIVMPADIGVNVTRDGELVAEGADETPVVFTGAQPQRGYWKGLRFQSPSIENRLRHVVVEHAGSDVAAIEVEEFGRVSLEDVKIRSSEESGLTLREGATLQTMRNVSFEGIGTYPVVTYGNSLPMLDAASDYTGAAEPFVRIVDSDAIDKDATWKKLNVPYLFGPNSNNRHLIHATVTIDPGTSLIFESQMYLRTREQGAIRAFGTAQDPITFTGLQGTQGFWGGLWISGSRMSEFDFTVIEYGGGFKDANGRHQANLYVDRRAHAVIENSTVQHSARFGLATERNGTLETSSNTYAGNLGDEVECKGGTRFPDSCTVQ